jgi:uncharacterized protein
MPTFLLLFLGAFCAAAVSGSAGFGGALLLLPLLVSTVGVTEAVPLLTVAQLVGNGSRAGFAASHVHWRLVAQFLSTAIPFSVLGSLSFTTLPRDLLTRFIGVAILVFVVLKFFGLLTLKPTPYLLVSGGIVVGFLSGLLGSAGPLGAALFLSLGLNPLAYVATDAVASLVMHAAKSATYQQQLELSSQFWPLAALMGVAMILGTYLAKGILKRVSPETFRRYTALLLVVIAGYMVIVGSK